MLASRNLLRLRERERERSVYIERERSLEAGSFSSLTGGVVSTNTISIQIATRKVMQCCIKKREVGRVSNELWRISLDSEAPGVNVMMGHTLGRGIETRYIPGLGEWFVIQGAMSR